MQTSTKLPFRNQNHASKRPESKSQHRQHTLTDVHETKQSKTPEYRQNAFSLFRTSPFSRIAFLKSYPIKIFHWHYRNVASALMNFLRLGYDSLMGAALESRQYGGCFDEEIQSSLRIGGSRFPFILFSMGHAA
jgi:hypothetical protein